MKKCKWYRALITASLIVLIVSTTGCINITINMPGGGVESSKSEATTDSGGIATLEVEGQPIAVHAVDKTSPSQSLPNVEVSVAEQQGVGLIYTVDKEGKFFPQLTFLNSGLSKACGITVPLSPVGDKDWVMSEPTQIDINPASLPKAASFQYSQFGSFLSDTRPEVRTIVLLFTEQVSDIEHSTVSICTSPFTQVIYAYVQEGHNVTGLEVIPRAHAVELHAVALVLYGLYKVGEYISKVGTCAKVAAEVEEWYERPPEGNRQMPDLIWCGDEPCTENEAKSKLSKANIDWEGNLRVWYKPLPVHWDAEDREYWGGKVYSQNPPVGSVWNVYVYETEWLLLTIQVYEPSPELAETSPECAVLSLEEISQQLPDPWYGNFEQNFNKVWDGDPRHLVITWHREGAPGYFQVIVVSQIRDVNAYLNREWALRWVGGTYDDDVVSNAQVYITSTSGRNVVRLTSSGADKSGCKVDLLTMTAGLYCDYWIIALTADAPVDSMDLWEEVIRRITLWH